MPGKKTHSHFHHLKHKWITKHRDLQKSLWEKHKDALQWAAETFSPKHLVTGSLAGLLLLSAPTHVALPLPNILAHEKPYQDIDDSVFMITDLAGTLPDTVQELSPEQEQRVSEILSKTYGVKAVPELEGKRLNRSYGYIGAEQHLARYPGDTMESHFDNPEDAQKYYSSGMAPGLGAYGYFAQSQSMLTEKDVQREKYYIAVQTFLSPGFMDNVREQYMFYKYRKMLVVNPNNGRAVVAVVADAGPAKWTGKHLGGSPEVMKYLQRVDGRQKGPVIYFFLDDPDDTIPLGPIEQKI